MKPGATTRSVASMLALPVRGLVEMAVMRSASMPDVGHLVVAGLGVHHPAAGDDPVEHVALGRRLGPVDGRRGVLDPFALDHDLRARRRSAELVEPLGAVGHQGADQRQVGHAESCSQQQGSPADGSRLLVGS